MKVHPVTGRPALYIGRHAYGIPGLAEEVSEQLLNELIDFACRRRRVLEHRWSAVSPRSRHLQDGVAGSTRLIRTCHPKSKRHGCIIGSRRFTLFRTAMEGSPARSQRWFSSSMTGCPWWYATGSEGRPYIKALEAADRGDLQPLVTFFAGLQRQEFVKALGIAHDVERGLRVETRIQSMRQRLAQRRDALAREWEQAKSNATTLHELTRERLEDVARLLEDAFNDHPEFRFFVDGDTDEGERAHYFQRQIVTTAKALGYYANTKHYRSWVRLVARDGDHCQILVALHAIGHHFQGVLACSGTWFRRVQTDDGVTETEGETALSDTVFQINYREAPGEIESRFRGWLEGVVERGLALWESTAL